MDNHKTPKPGSPEYPIDQPQHLNTPEFNSSGRRTKDEIPPVENMNDEQSEANAADAVDISGTDPDLGNNRTGNEKQRERIIKR